MRRPRATHKRGCRRSGEVTALTGCCGRESMEGPEMPRITNGMPATLLRMATWIKSRHSNPSGECVELAKLANGDIAVRNSRHPGGPALIFTRAEMAAFILGVEDGEFDEMAE